ncbi:hemerythrin domain-containing protein [Archangium violaceum]|uniref:hemerythrin domain-containing protein n=1 Tax=Archangium violaceum TaxID=83451 RepID=UPI0037C083E1
MMRDTRLRGLSAEHQDALLFGRRLLEVSTAPEQELNPAWEVLRRRFFAEVQPHFLTEEQELLPALESLGEEALVARVWEDHEALRALVTDEAEPLRIRLEKLGLRLIAHVRFEEAQVFELAQRRLPPEVLERIARRTPPPPTRTGG